MPASACSAVSVSDELGVRLGQRFLGVAAGVGDRRDPGFGLARLPLHGGEHVAGLRQLALRLAPQLAQAPLLALRRAQALGGLLGGGARGLGRAARLGLLARQRAQPAALGQPRGGGGRHLRGGDEAVPAPQMALARDEALAGLQQTLQARAVRGVDDADLAQAARQLGRRPRRGPTSGSTPAGSGGIGLRAPRSGANACGASGATGASRSSPSAAASAIS